MTVFGMSETGMPDNPVSLLVYFLSLWIMLAVVLKRAHDREKGGGWVVFFLWCPIVGWAWGLVELGFLKGDVGANFYGPSPKRPREPAIV